MSGSGLIAAAAVFFAILVLASVSLEDSRLMGALHKNEIDINRKVLADLAMNHPEAFKAIVDKVK